MSAGPPGPFTTRAPAPGDAEAILAVTLARDLADGLQPDISLAHVQDELAQPAAGSVVVEDDARAVVAFALLNGGIDAHVVVRPDSCGRGLGTFLAAAIERAARAAQAPMLRQEINSSNPAGADLLKHAGYGHEQSYWRMERELDAGEADPRFPDGIEVRQFERGRDDRAAYELVSGAMAAVPGNTDRTFEEWRSRALGSALTPELSAVALDGSGAMVGIALCERRQGAEGYIDYLAVAPEVQGRGLGRELLARSFRAFADEGMRHAALWVNGSNESATRLYRRAGMNAAFRADRYVKSLIRS